MKILRKDAFWLAVAILAGLGLWGGILAIYLLLRINPG